MAGSLAASYHRDCRTLQVGDLVRTNTLWNKPLGIITKIEGTTGRWYYVLYPGTDRAYPFSVSQLEKV